MKHSRQLAVALLSFISLLSASVSSAATFIVPTDREMVRKAPRIVRATAIDSYSRLTESGSIETVTELDVTEVLKGGTVAGNRLQVVHIGGAVENLALVVPGSPTFQKGEEVLLFLVKKRNGNWTSLDFALGKFSREGRFFLRDSEEIVGWNTDGGVHNEKARAAEPFLNFIRETVAGTRIRARIESEAPDSEAPDEEEYLEEMPVRESTAVSNGKLRIAANAFAASAYLSTITFGGTTRPYRWSSFGSGIVFDRGNSHPSYLNGGADSIVAATATWTNDCASNVLYSFGALNTLATSGFTASDGRHAVIFEDPNNEIDTCNTADPSCTNPDSAFNGNGTLAIGGVFISNAEHSFNGETFYTAGEAEVIVQNGVSAATGITESEFHEMMTHEIGHTLGFRHSNESGKTPNTTSAIMVATLNGTFGTTLQPYDVDAVRAAYASGSCVAITAPTNLVATASSATSVAVSWTASDGAASYKVFRSANGSTFAQVGAPTGTSFTDTSATANTSYLYRVKAVDASSNESGDSNSDLATTVAFTDNVITIGSTPVKAVHFSELRTAVNAVRTLAGLSLASFTDSTLSSAVAVKSLHVTELRSALDLGRSTLGLSAIAYVDPTITAGSTLLKAAHVTDLRGGTQ